MRGPDGGVCQDFCDDGFTTNGSKNKVCEKCSDTCQTCQDTGKVGDNKRCVVCHPQYPLRINGDECTDQCGLGFFQSGGYCDTCRSPCLGCNVTESTCTACNPASELPALFED